MEIYAKNKNGQLEQTSIAELLKTALNASGFGLSNGSFAGENHNWIGIVQRSKKPAEVTVNVTFEDDGNTITGVKVYETPIKVIVDEDNGRQII